MNNPTLFPAYPQRLKRLTDDYSKRAGQLSAKQVASLQSEAALLCVELFRKEMSSMTEAQAFASLAREDWDDFTLC
jgi:hypothetical protein